MKYILKSDNYQSNYLVNLLNSRGIFDIENYLNPSKENLLDCNLLCNIKEAADCLLKHLNNNSTIGIVIDSDQDGFTSTAILWNYIKLIFPNANLNYFLHEGKQHGLEDFCEKIINQNKYDLIIMPDASSNDYDYHKSLKEHGIDVIVLDHHDAEKLSEDAIVVNNQLSTNYENKALSGAGVVYKFCVYLDNRLGKNFANQFLDLAAIGIIGDMMDLRTLENRYIVSEGLKNIKNACIIQIIEKQSYSIGDTDNLNPTHIAFYITPLINALIRVGSQQEKESLFQALINGNEMVPSTKRGAKGTYESLGTQCARNCVNARSRQNRAKEKAIDELEIKIFNDNLDENKVIFIPVEPSNNIDSTLTGLIAMQIMNKYKKPVIIAKENNEGYFRGSARGDSKSELKNLKTFFQNSGLFEYAEGHECAHGVSIHKKNIDKFISYANEELKDINFNEGVYEIDFIRNSNAPDLKDLINELGKYSYLWG